MRNIKFRAWNKKNKKFSFLEDLVLYIDGGGVYELYENRDETNEWMEQKEVTDNYIIMQYTGLKDKNGIEIYEGDIIRINSSVYEVKYSTGYYFAGFEPFERGLIHSSNFEIIGNIYKNPELLKEENVGN